MSNPWFRLYSEFSHDPKVQMMSEAMQRRYVMLMCMRCSNYIVTLHETEIAFQLRITETELAETKALFISKGFIDENWNLLNWEKRQFKSDSSRERVARHRAKKKEEVNNDVTLQKRKSNVLDTDTDTDTEYKKTNKKENSTDTDSVDAPCVVSDFSDFAEPQPAPTESPQPENPVSVAGAIAAYCRSQGINANPSQQLKQLIGQGADMAHFVEAIPIAKQAGKGFSYLLGIVKNMLAEPPKARASPAKPTVSGKFDPVAYVNQGRIQNDSTIIDI